MKKLLYATLIVASILFFISFYIGYTIGDKIEFNIKPEAIIKQEKGI